jgi:hypothetical protein
MRRIYWESEGNTCSFCWSLTVERISEAQLKAIERKLR